MNPAPLIALVAFMAGVYLLLSSQRAGSGGGAITTESSEGSWADPVGIANQTEAVFTEAAAVFSGGTQPVANPTTLSPDGRARLELLEGFAAEPYADFKGNSIGFGHLIKVGESYTHLTRDQASEILSSDVAWAETAVRSAVTVMLAQPQFDALVSFCFNVGAGAFKRSTLVKRINAADPGASSEFDRWVYAGGQVNPGLVDRRRAERTLYESAQA